MNRTCLVFVASWLNKDEWRQVFTDQSALGWKKSKNSSIMPVARLPSSALQVVVLDCAQLPTKPIFQGRNL